MLLILDMSYGVDMKKMALNTVLLDMGIYTSVDIGRRGLLWI